jgi:ABC-type taurine transport system substrate-binding protein
METVWKESGDKVAGLWKLCGNTVEGVPNFVKGRGISMDDHCAVLMPI